MYMIRSGKRQGATATTRNHKSMNRTKSFTKLYTFRGKNHFLLSPRSVRVAGRFEQSQCGNDCGRIRGNGVSAQPRPLSGMIKSVTGREEPSYRHPT